MRMIYLLKSFESTAKSLLRKRIFPVLILVVPAVFFIITDYTTTNMFFSLKLASLTGVVVDVSQKQSVCGFKVVKYSVKKTKDGEVLDLVLSANVEDVKAGDLEFGSVLQSLWGHQASDTEVGITVLKS